MQTKNTHWPSILILIVLGTCALFVLLFVAATGISSIIALFSESGDPAGEMISTFAFGLELLVLLVCMWFVFQKAQSREQADLSFKFPFANWQILAVLGLIGFSVMLGAAVIYTEVLALAWVTLPFLTLLVIVPPIWIFLGLGTKGIDFGSRWKVFSILGLGLTLAPVTMVVLELIILFVIIVAGTVFLAFSQPDLLQEVTAIGRILQNETDQSVILNLVAPYLSSPAVIVTLIGYIGFIVPLIEELLKPLGVWLFARKFNSPAQGFAMGMLSGGAFAWWKALMPVGMVQPNGCGCECAGWDKFVAHGHHGFGGVGHRFGFSRAALFTVASRIFLCRYHSWVVEFLRDRHGPFFSRRVTWQAGMADRVCTVHAGRVGGAWSGDVRCAAGLEQKVKRRTCHHSDPSSRNHGRDGRKGKITA
jgi:hypothetical protein